MGRCRSSPSFALLLSWVAPPVVGLRNLPRTHRVAVAVVGSALRGSVRRAANDHGCGNVDCLTGSAF